MLQGDEQERGRQIANRGWFGREQFQQTGKRGRGADVNREAEIASQKAWERVGLVRAGGHQPESFGDSQSREVGESDEVSQGVEVSESQDAQLRLDLSGPPKKIKIKQRLRNIKLAGCAE